MWSSSRLLSCFFFFNDTATTEIYTLSLHDALPISGCEQPGDLDPRGARVMRARGDAPALHPARIRSEEHTSELQSQSNLVCRLLLEKKKMTTCALGTICDRVLGCTLFDSTCPLACV